MSWKALLEQRRVAREDTTHDEVESLKQLAEVALADASVERLSDDGRFERAYDAARALATIVIRASGYRVKGSGGGHYNTFLALEAANPARFRKVAAYLNLCREKRNEISYVAPGRVTPTEVREILDQVPRLRDEVPNWLRDEHPELG